MFMHLKLLLFSFEFKDFPLSNLQVMETKNMLYIVTEYASNGEMFGKYFMSFIKSDNIVCASFF